MTDLPWQKRFHAMLGEIPNMARAAAREHGSEIYLYCRPAKGQEWGAFAVAGHEKPVGFELVTSERIGHVPFDAIPSRFRDLLRRCPVIGADPPVAETVDRITEYGSTRRLSRPVRVF